MSDIQMKKFFPEINEAKVERMYQIRLAYDRGELSLQQAKAAMKEEVGSVTPEEFAYAEQKFNPITEDAENECQTESLRDILAVFGDTLQIAVPDLPEGHPIDTYYRENKALRSVIGEMMELHKAKFIKNPWLELMDRLAQIKVHYSRKQNQLYSMLERKGFEHPSKAMWTYDDHNRDLINAARTLLDADRHEEFLDSLPTIFTDVLDLISKEETILLPVSLRMISEEEFRSMRSGDDEIGYCLIERPEGFLPFSPSSDPKEEVGFEAELKALLSKYKPSRNEVLDVAQGKLTLEQINLIYRHMHVDFSYVDENEIVKFYSDTRHRVFPRSAGVIGRQVRNCHPPKSVHVVEEIIEKFRTGEKDFVEFWINKPELFIYITYTAVRDEEGNFRGVLEMMQDCTHIRSLKGSRTLLTWEDENKSADVPDGSQEKVPEASEPAKISEACDLTSTLSAETKVSAIIERYPAVKARLKEIHPNFSAMNNPVLWQIMKHKASIGTMAERSGLTVEHIIEHLRQFMNEQKP